MLSDGVRAGGGASGRQRLSPRPVLLVSLGSWNARQSSSANHRPFSFDFVQQVPPSPSPPYLPHTPGPDPGHGALGGPRLRLGGPPPRRASPRLACLYTLRNHPLPLEHRPTSQGLPQARPPEACGQDHTHVGPWPCCFRGVESGLTRTPPPLSLPFFVASQDPSLRHSLARLAPLIGGCLLDRRRPGSLRGPSSISRTICLH